MHHTIAAENLRRSLSCALWRTLVSLGCQQSPQSAGGVGAEAHRVFWTACANPLSGFCSCGPKLLQEKGHYIFLRLLGKLCKFVTATAEQNCLATTWRMWGSANVSKCSSLPATLACFYSVNIRIFCFVASMLLVMCESQVLATCWHIKRQLGACDWSVQAGPLPHMK